MQAGRPEPSYQVILHLLQQERHRRIYHATASRPGVSYSARRGSLRCCVDVLRALACLVLCGSVTGEHPQRDIHLTRIGVGMAPCSTIRGLLLTQILSIKAFSCFKVPPTQWANSKSSTKATSRALKKASTSAVVMTEEMHPMPRGAMKIPRFISARTSSESISRSLRTTLR